jgi:hypothetical protein
LVNGSREIGLKSLLIAALAALLFVPAGATPIRPDLKRLLAEPQATQQFVPARAGWQGPETPTPPPVHADATSRAVRASLWAAAIPDPLAVLGIALAILFLRWVRLSPGRQQLRPHVADEELPEIRRAA